MFRLFNFIPALLTTIIIALAAIFVSGSNPKRALETAFAQAGRYRHGMRGWPVAAMAGALGVTLAGPPNGWVGPKDSSAKVTAEDLERCAMLHFVFFLCSMSIISTGILVANLYIF